MSVRILIDLYHTQKHSGVYHVENQQDYLEACRSIDQALIKETELEVALHNPAMKGWFDHYKERQGIEIISCNPCDMLAGVLGVNIQELPTQIRQDPGVIILENLLEKARKRPLKKGESVLSWIIAATLGSVWAEESIRESSQLIELLLKLASEHHQVINPTILSLKEQQIISWLSNFRFKRILNWVFSGNPSKRAHSLLLYCLIKNYPLDTRKEALGFDGRWVELSFLDDLQQVSDIIPIEFCSSVSIPGGYAYVIRNYLENCLKERSISEVIPLLSGYLEEEERVLRNYLVDNLRNIDETWASPLQELESVFAKSGKFRSFIVFLRRIKPVIHPPQLPLNSTWHEVKDWLTIKYFPFMSWCLSVGRLKNTTTAVSEFEGWLLKNYYELTRTNAFAPYAVREIINKHTKDIPVLFVIIDGLSWVYTDYLLSEFSGRGMKNIEVNVGITTIPSITSIAKPSLVRGQLPGQLQLDEKGQVDYTGMFASALGIKKSDVCFGTSLDISLKDMVRKKKKAYLYLFNDVDQLIHKPLSREKRRSDIEFAISRLVEEAVEAKIEFNNIHRQEVILIISSDHGYTEIPEDASCLKLPSNQECIIKHGRIIENNATVTLDNMVVIDSRMLGGAKSTYLVPRGYAFIESKPKGATHGGLSPQEVTVPIFIMGISKDIAYKNIELSITGEVRRGRSQNPVIIKLVNNNPVFLIVKSINLHLISKMALPIQINPNDNVQLEAMFNGAQLRQKQVEVTGIIICEFMGEVVTTDIALVIETTGAALADQSFEEDFDV